MSVYSKPTLVSSLFVVASCLVCLFADVAGAQAPHPGSSLTPALRVKHQNMRIDRALANGRIDKQQADDLRKAVSEVADRLKSDRPLDGDELAGVQDKLNANMARIQACLGQDSPRAKNTIMQSMKAEERRELREEKQRNLEAMQKKSG